MSDREHSPARRGPGSQDSPPAARDIDNFDEGPQFDPERGVVCPAGGGAPSAVAQRAGPCRAPEDEPALELDPQAAAHAFASSRAAGAERVWPPAPDGEPPPAAAGRALRKRPARRALFAAIAAIAAGIGAALYLGAATPARAPGSAQPTPLRESLDEIGAQGRALMERAESSFEATRRSIEGLSSTPLLVIESTPSGAEIWLDGEWLGNTPFAGDNRAAAGAHELRLRLKGYRDAVLAIEGGASSRLNVALRRR